VLRDFRIVFPQLRARLHVVRLHHAPCRSEIHHAVDDDRCRFLTALGVDVRVPRESERLHVRVVHLIERTEALLAIAAPGREPRAGLVVSDESRSIDGARAEIRGYCRFLFLATARSEHRNRDERNNPRKNSVSHVSFSAIKTWCPLCPYASFAFTPTPF